MLKIGVTAFCSLRRATCIHSVLFRVCRAGGGKRSRDACPRPTLRNGKIKPRSNGRVVKYSCNRDFVLVGESTSTCLLGEWTSEAPVCASK